MKLSRPFFYYATHSIRISASNPANFQINTFMGTYFSPNWESGSDCSIRKAFKMT